MVNLSNAVASLGVFHAIVKMRGIHILFLLFQEFLVIGINEILILDQYIACLEIPFSLLMKITIFNSRFLAGLRAISRKLFDTKV